MANFIFMDESHTPNPDNFALTGVLLPLSHYREARTLFSQVLLRFSELGRWTVNREFMELHGVKMLDWLEDADDDLKLETFSAVVGVVERLGLRVFRVVSDPQSFFRPMKELDSLKMPEKETLFLRFCWGEMIRSLESTLENELVIPTMDNVDQRKVQQISGLVTFLDQMRAVEMAGNLSISYSENIAGEVFYADSRFSFGIQVADVVGYLRQGSDLALLGLDQEITPFKSNLIKISSRLDPHIVERRIGVPKVQSSGWVTLPVVPPGVD